MAPSAGAHFASDLQVSQYISGPHFACGHCAHVLECVEQNRRSGTWISSFICPNCRSEYFYAYRWGQLVKKSA